MAHICYTAGTGNDEMIDICLALDASGSISNEQCKEFLTEVKNIMDQYKDFRIHLWSFDTEVFNPVVFTPDNCRRIVRLPTRVQVVVQSLNVIGIT